MGEHRWGQAFDGARRCINAGCEVRLSFIGRWQLRPGCRWVSPTRRQLPPCTGGPEPERCTHVHRVQLALNPGHDVVGGLKTGQCERPALPRLVVCEEHATPDALRIVILSMAAEIERLKSGG